MHGVKIYEILVKLTNLLGSYKQIIRSDRSSMRPGMDVVKDAWNFVIRRLNDRNVHNRNLVEFQPEVVKLWKDLSQALMTCLSDIASSHLPTGRPASARYRAATVIARQGNSTRCFNK